MFLFYQCAPSSQLIEYSLKNIIGSIYCSLISKKGVVSSSRSIIAICSIIAPPSPIECCVFVSCVNGTFETAKCSHWFRVSENGTLAHRPSHSRSVMWTMSTPPSRPVVRRLSACRPWPNGIQDSASLSSSSGSWLWRTLRHARRVVPSCLGGCYRLESTSGDQWGLAKSGKEVRGHIVLLTFTIEVQHGYQDGAAQAGGGVSISQPKRMCSRPALNVYGEAWGDYEGPGIRIEVRHGW